jgi:hypothetical protein
MRAKRAAEEEGEGAKDFVYSAYTGQSMPGAATRAVLTGLVDAFRTGVSQCLLGCIGIQLIMDFSSGGQSSRMWVESVAVSA